MRALLFCSLFGTALLGTAACEVHVENNPPPATPAQPAGQPASQPAEQPAPHPVGKPSGPTTPPSPTPAPAMPKPDSTAGGGATSPTPSGVEAGCYNKCLEQNIMQATAPQKIKEQCQARCTIADKCVDTKSEPECQRCCRGNRARGATFDGGRCTCN